VGKSVAAILFAGTLWVPWGLPAAETAMTSVTAPTQATSGESLGTSDDTDQGAWTAYQRSVASALAQSDRPRDWALAAIMFTFTLEEIRVQSSGRASLLDRAAHAAPDDVLVQWIVANEAACAACADSTDSVRALERLQPDNAASWMMALGRTPPGDPTSADELLSRMSSSLRFDDHMVESLRAWLDAYDRFPPPASLLGRDSPLPHNASLARSTLAFTGAFTQATSSVLPAYQRLMSACRPGTPASGQWLRNVYCEDIGRMMANTGPTFLVRMIGSALLRNGGGASALDLENRREIQWIRQNHVRVSGYVSGDEAVIDAYQNDWRTLDDEIEIGRRALRRVGLPEKPPEGWSDTAGFLVSDSGD